jgi:dTDP-4-amino-4,6-dideoxygalactose transaminase
MKVPLSDIVVTEEDLAAAVEAYRSGWLSMGPRTERLERDIAEYTGAQHAIAVANGTAALHLICAATGLGPGDDVVVPSLTFVATVNAIAYTGARPVFADIADVTKPWLSATAAEAAITSRTKAVMAMAYGGHPGEISALSALARQNELLLLEDAAHALGTRLGGRHLGTFGRAGAFSFFSNKNLGIGEGGMIVTDDADLSGRARLLRSHGMTALSWDRSRGSAHGYDVIALGFNYRIDDPRAALASARLSRLDRENDRRSLLAARYRQAFADVEGLSPALPPCDDARLAHHLFTIVLDEELDRDSFRRAVADRGVETGVHYQPVHRFRIYADGSQAQLPMTEAYANRCVTLPMFAHMSGLQQAQVIDAVTSAVRSERPARAARRD